VAGAVKLVPVMITDAPVAPLMGLIPIIVGEARTLKPDLDTLTPLVVISMGPSEAPVGTVAIIVVGEERVTLVDVTPLNFTITGAVKLVPVMIIVAPTAPLIGE
jgi:hypothetical protein